VGRAEYQYLQLPYTFSLSFIYFLFERMKVAEIGSWNLLFPLWGLYNCNRQAIAPEGRLLYDLMKPLWNDEATRKQYGQIAKNPKWQAFLLDGDRLQKQIEYMQSQTISIWCLQELTHDDAKLISSSLGMHFVFAPYRNDGPGVAIVYDAEVDHARSSPQMGPANSRAVHICLKNNTVIVSVHAKGFAPDDVKGMESSRADLQTMADQYAKQFPTETVLLAGDFNFRAGIDPLELQCYAEDYVCPEPTSTTSASDKFEPDPVVLDRAFIRNGMTVSVSCIGGKELSDHAPISIRYNKGV
jgi:endonuclease/exonuclease/phosphatase family metal-dependent hydrolase